MQCPTHADKIIICWRKKCIYQSFFSGVHLNGGESKHNLGPGKDFSIDRLICILQAHIFHKLNFIFILYQTQNVGSSSFLPPFEAVQWNAIWITMHRSSFCALCQCVLTPNGSHREAQRDPDRSSLSDFFTVLPVMLVESTYICLPPAAEWLHPYQTNSCDGELIVPSLN